MSAQIACVVERLIKMLPRLEQENLSEADTKRIIIEPILKVLGWDTTGIEDVRNEFRHRPSDNPVDYALLGAGSGLQYTPWIQVGEFPSLGVAKAVPGRKIKRLFSTLSQIERTFLERAEEDPSVTDILEQFPLDLRQTIEIAKELVIVHPSDHSTKNKRVMTTDFLLVKNSGLEACAIKHSSELQTTRTLQKLEIEQEYWIRKGIAWKLYTEIEAGPANARNTRWLAEELLFHGASFPKEVKDLIKQEAETRFQEQKNILTLAEEIDHSLKLSNQSLHVLKELIRERVWDWNSYHGLLELDKFRLERHWTGEKVLRAQVPLLGFEMDHQESNLHQIQLSWGRKINEKLKRKRRKISAKSRHHQSVKPLRTKLPKIRKPRPVPVDVLQRNPQIWQSNQPTKRKPF